MIKNGMEVCIVVAISADGKIAEKEGQSSREWASDADRDFFVQKTGEAGVVVMGRKTYETIGAPLPNRLNIVMTRRAADYESIEGTLEYTKASPESILTDLEIRGFKTVAVAGGSQVYSAFLKAGLITDLYLTIEPVLFGEGITLAAGFKRIDLELVETQKLSSQTMMLHYRVKGTKG